jgi:hypothetical protein
MNNADELDQTLSIKVQQIRTVPLSRRYEPRVNAV